ncbi:MAG: ornithine cyclodeaminase family protein [Gemmatimonadota bacterium]
MTTLMLTHGDIMRVLSMRDCIDAVERAFALDAATETIPSGVLGTHVDGGGFHVKTAGLRHGRPMFVAKVNANFPDNPGRRGLPTIQGVIALFDAACGTLLALLDSGAITSLRTAGASAVAAKYLAREDATVVTICGCGEQGRSQLRALHTVRALRVVYAVDSDTARAARFAAEMSRELGLEATVSGDLASAARRSDIIVTATTSPRWLLGVGDVSPGAFIAAVGADAPEKGEIDPALMAQSRVVVDVLAQCERMGDLHHAITAGAMQREDVVADLAEVVSGRKWVRRGPDDVVIFDSTGTALQDVAAAGLAYERAVTAGLGVSIDLRAR